MNRTKQITEAGLFSAILVVFIVGSFYIPFIGGILTLFLPLSVIVLASRNKISNVVVSAIVAGLISSAIVTLVYGLSMAAIALFVGLPIGEMIKRSKQPLQTVLVGGVGAIIVFFIFFFALEWTTGISLMDEIEHTFQLSMNLQGSMGTALEGIGVENAGETMAQSQQTLEDMLYLMRLILPSVLIIFSMFFSLVNMAMAHQILKRMHIDYVPFGSFAEFSYPRHLAYGSAGMVILAYIIGRLGWVDATLLTSNFMYLFLMLFGFQGLAVLYFYLQKFFGKISARVMLVAFFLLGGFQYVALFGFMDVLFNFRKLGATKE